VDNSKKAARKVPDILCCFFWDKERICKKMLYFAAVRIILTVVHICTTVLHNGRHERAATQAYAA